MTVKRTRKYRVYPSERGRVMIEKGHDLDKNSLKEETILSKSIDHEN